MQIHALDGGPRRTFAQVVQARDGNEALAIAEYEQIDAIGIVAALDVEKPLVEIVRMIERSSAGLSISVNTMMRSLGNRRRR